MSLRNLVFSQEHSPGLREGRVVGMAGSGNGTISRATLDSLAASCLASPSLCGVVGLSTMDGDDGVEKR